MTQPTAPPARRLLGTLGAIRVVLETDLAVEPGHQWILFSAPAGYGLAAALAPEIIQQVNGLASVAPQYVTPDGQWVRIPHTAVVDAGLRQLVDLGTAIRMASPGLVQLSFVDEQA